MQVSAGATFSGLNPLRWEYDSTFAEPDASSWAKLTLLMRKRDGGVVDAEVLRPRAWIEAAGIAVGKPLPLNLPELDIREQVEVTAIEACPAIAEGAGSVVTARFVTREAHLVASVQLRGPRGELETLTGTQQHPIWSVDRRDWVPLSELREGERLLCSHPSPPWGRGTEGEGANHAIVLGVTLSTVCEPVYNLEIHGEHVYQVGELGVLVHNGTPGIDGCPLGSAGVPSSGATGSTGRLRDAKTGRYISDPSNPPSPYKMTDAQRRAHWKQLAEDPNSPLDAAQRAEIKGRGWRGPQQLNEFGELETMELSHEPIPLREGGKNVIPRWPADHAAIDKYRRLKRRQ